MKRLILILYIHGCTAKTMLYWYQTISIQSTRFHGGVCFEQVSDLKNSLACSSVISGVAAHRWCVIPNGLVLHSSKFGVCSFPAASQLGATTWASATGTTLTTDTHASPTTTAISNEQRSIVKLSYEHMHIWAIYISLFLFWVQLSYRLIPIEVNCRLILVLVFTGVCWFITLRIGYNIICDYLMVLLAKLFFLGYLYRNRWER